MYERLRYGGSLAGLYGLLQGKTRLTRLNKNREGFIVGNGDLSRLLAVDSLPISTGGKDLSVNIFAARGIHLSKLQETVVPRTKWIMVGEYKACT